MSDLIDTVGADRAITAHLWILNAVLTAVGVL
jgi:hypothetical protein